MSPNNLRYQYSEALAKYNFGHAVPIPVSSNEMRIGQCGYFDDTETWNPIVQVTDSEEVAAAGFVPMDATALKGLSVHRTEAEWGPLTSDTVTAYDPKLDVGATIPGVPVEASIQFEVSNESSFGAVLTTEKPVIQEYYYRYESPWKDWIKNNSKILMERYGREIYEYKLWIITQVYMTRTARINILQSSKRKVSIGFKADVAQIGKLEPHGGWSTDNKNDGWSVHSSKEGEQRIVFITGFYFGCNIFKRNLKGRRLPQAPSPPENRPFMTMEMEHWTVETPWNVEERETLEMNVTVIGENPGAGEGEEQERDEIKG
ncbi:hypothetical protein AALT_g11999 [Alternaria alternata]|nr:hypothetical protein AALT_g11999 [Alternaria alternata]